MKIKKMNKTICRFIAMWMLLSTIVDVTAQQYQNVTIYTPNNSAVTAGNLISSDLTQDQKNNSKNYWLSQYNNRIEYIAEATCKYNCHAYAWHVSEGGSQVWINTPEDNKYWSDYSYTDVSSNPSVATKVSFGGPCYYWDADENKYVDLCDHSAVTTSTSNYFISKWGRAPRFRHHKDDCPYPTACF